uniref:26S proteasome non-ATPase regulatory subunit 10 n=1 Tax=Timema poppense TaxID=170557 RepID=A0A7R9H0Q5_TIMPO|nr:unnamed protein product [Timema poppensis]
MPCLDLPAVHSGLHTIRSMPCLAVPFLALLYQMLIVSLRLKIHQKSVCFGPRRNNLGGGGDKHYLFLPFSPVDLRAAPSHVTQARIMRKKHALTEMERQHSFNARLLIHWAALGGHEEIVGYLLEKGSPVDPGDDIAMTPLILASSAGKEDVVHTLVAQGAQVNARNQEGHSSLQYAASKGWNEIVQLLLANDADVNIVDKRGATPLHRAASKGNTEVVKTLLDSSDIKVDPSDAYGNTPLHLACEENRTEEAKMLVLRGAHLDVENKEKKTPLDLAPPALVRQLVALKEH